MNQEANIQNEWMPQSMEQSQVPPTDLAGMDQLVLRLKEAREIYDEAKKKASEEYHKLEEVEQEVMNALKANGRTKFEAEGVALVYFTDKEVYTTPKTPEQKQALFDYIQSKHGKDALTGMLSINHQTLNSFANKESEADPGTVIPGLDAPTSVQTLFFRKK